MGTPGRSAMVTSGGVGRGLFAGRTRFPIPSPLPRPSLRTPGLQADPLSDRRQGRQVGAGDKVAVLPLFSPLEPGRQLPALDQPPDRGDRQPHRYRGLRDRQLRVSEEIGLMSAMPIMDTMPVMASMR